MEVRVAGIKDFLFIDELVSWYKESARQRGTGIAERNPEYLQKKMESGDSVIALDEKGEVAGFSYIETFENNTFVVNSGLIVRVEFRGTGLGQKIKNKIFELSRTQYPKAKIFSITTSLPVMKLNTELGFKPVTFSEITTSDEFWNGCKSCKNYAILSANERKMCLCTGLVYDNLKDKYSKKNTDE